MADKADGGVDGAHRETRRFRYKRDVKKRDDNWVIKSRDQNEIKL